MGSPETLPDRIGQNCPLHVGLTMVAVMTLRRRLQVLAVLLIAILGTGVTSWFWYPQHVEDEFAATILHRPGGSSLSVVSSRCVGRDEDTICLRPIIFSKATGTYPYLGEIKGPSDRSYMEVIYWHGYWFNYCKRVVRGGTEELFAFWSLKEDRWHLVRWKDFGERWGWEEVVD
jgi:hypothetical protein